MRRELLPAVVSAPSLCLPMIELPRTQWPVLLGHAAAAIEGGCVPDSQSLAAELRGIAAAVRAECPP